MEETIFVHVACDKNTTQYVEFMWNTMLKLAASPEKLFLHAHCIGPKAAEMLKTLQQIKTHVVAIKEGGSAGHAACIMDALKMMTDQNIHIICDSDAFVVSKGWDIKVRQKSTQGIGILGTTYEDKGGFSSGSGDVQTYKKVPTFTWAILNPGYPWNTLDVMPNKNHRIAITNEKLSKIYNLPTGHAIFGEAGWQLPQFLYDQQIKYEGWKQLKPTKDAIILKGLSDYHEEYHVDGIPFVVHHRGSMKHPYRGSKISNCFFSKVDEWIANEVNSEQKWIETKNNWIQLNLPFEYNEPEPERILPLFENKPNGWIKATVDQQTILPKTKFLLMNNKLSYNINDNINHIHYIRFEGIVNSSFYVEVPNKIHMITFRNMTNVPITIQKDATGLCVKIDSMSTKLLIIDVDGVITC